MRWSSAFIPTLREAPADAEASSHRLLVRGGFIRQLHAGHYSLLPLGLRVHDKIAKIVREEMDAIGGQEFLLPAMHPASLWKQSGRWELMGEEMFRLQDRSGVDLALGMTHEEIFSNIATTFNSYKELPQIWYQIQTKFRDEPRPKSGLLRVREFAMKDSYSFDLDDAGLDRAFQAHHDAYAKIFERLDLDAMSVQASSGSMGGSASIEFMVPSPAGEDDVLRCVGCDYKANVERGTSTLDPVVDEPGPKVPEKFPTPGVRSIAALEEIEGGAPAKNQIKTMVMVLDDAITLALLRGDHRLNLQKLQDQSGAVNIRPAEVDETIAALGASPGSLGAVGVTSMRVIADSALEGRTNMTTGANEDDWHFRGVSLQRDVEVDEWADLREVQAGETCIECGGTLEVIRCIEAGHIFKLGRKYAEAMGVSVLDAEGHSQIPTMGSYGIGIGRAVAAVAENHNDESGLIWPLSVAPYQMLITVLDVDDETSMGIASEFEVALQEAGIEVLVDDRDARPGVKFADAELIGIPYRVTVGVRGLANNEVELTPRSTGETKMIDRNDLLETVLEELSPGM
ncbi:MAG: proline--tRNA ligase [Acidimicrobiales bacterium]|jgi:prolyl-tRNA synthetase|nr:proline--tRNA ligase [Acidimicrobiales bacterium]